MSTGHLIFNNITLALLCSATRNGHKDIVNILLQDKRFDDQHMPCLALAALHQKDDLTRQASLLSTYCTARGWNHEVIQDLGSGMNYHKQGLKKLLDHILERKIRRLVITHKDRLLRFGAELVFALCQARQIEVVIVNQGEDVSFEEELAKDVLEIITVFSARLYGARSHKNKKLIEAAKVLIGDDSSESDT